MKINLDKNQDAVNLEKTKEAQMSNIKFETISDTLCRMVEPTPLQPDSPMPCVVRLIQDDSPMGKYNQSYSEYRYGVALGCCMLPIIATHIAKNGVVNDVEWDVNRYEIIGYPVADGSAEWALWQRQNKRSVITDTGVVMRYHYDDETCNALLRVYPTGWQLYEPQPKPKQLLADAQAGDLCKHRNGDWSQIIDTNGTYIPGQPIRTTLKDTNGINRNFCLSGSHFTMQFGGEYDIIATEPLAPKGTAEWAWQMLILQKPVSHPAEGIWRDTYYSKDGFVRCMAKTGWQLYEPKPAYAEGDWVECRSTLDGRLIQDQIVDVDADGFVTRDLEEFGCFTFDGQFHYDTLPPCQCEYYTITRKLKPSEVVVHIGCLSGTVEKACDFDLFLLWHSKKDCDYSMIRFDALDEPTHKLVNELLEKQGEGK